MKQRTIVLIHVVLWLLLILPISCSSIVVFKFYPEFIWSFYPEATINYILSDAFYNALSFGLSFYLFYFFFFEWLFRSPDLKLGVLKSLGLFLLLYLLELLVVLNLYPENLVKKDFWIGIEVGLFIWLLSRVGLSIGARGFIEYIHEKERRKELEYANFQSELSLFRAQVNPHFLFNTLNNIDALIHIDPDKASAALIQLSKQMRYLLYDSNVTKINLKDEISFIQNYIDLETIRIKNKKFISFDIRGNLQGIQIAPMLLIAFVENAFKHSNDKHKDKGLEISLSIIEDNLLFKCKNTFDASLTPNHLKYSGIGLDLVKKRLELIYKTNYNLIIRQDNYYYAVELSIPLIYLN